MEFILPEIFLASIRERYWQIVEQAGVAVIGEDVSGLVAEPGVLNFFLDGCGEDI